MNDKIRVSPQALWIMYDSFLPRNSVEEEQMCFLNIENEEDIFKLVGMVRRCTLDCFDNSGVTLCRESFAYYIVFHIDMVLEGIESLSLHYNFPDDMKTFLERIWELLFSHDFPKSLNISDYHVEIMSVSDMNSLYVKPLRPPVLDCYQSHDERLA